MLSRTASSGRPTSTVFGKPAEASTSTSTGTASIPCSAKVFNLASMEKLSPCRRRQRSCSKRGHGGAERLLLLLDLGRARVEDQPAESELGREPADEQHHDSNPDADPVGERTRIPRLGPGVPQVVNEPAPEDEISVGADQHDNGN